MDGNKEDALKCVRIGKEAIQSGDRARALKFLSKARRLDPDLQVDDLISSVEKEDDDQTTKKEQPRSAKEPSRSSTQSKPSDQPSLRQRGSSSAANGSSPTSPTFTVEQMTIVREIKKKKDYYEILGLDKNCTLEDVRKAYRKLSLKVHPDKNQAPGAEEAFKSVSKAFQCLGSEESRRKYDVTGSDEPVVQRQTAQGHRHFNGFNGYYDNEFDADEIFRNFFFGGMPPAATRQFRTFNFGGGAGAGARTADNGSGTNLRMLLQLLPVLFILLINFLPSSEPVYSLSRSYPYEYKFTTQKGVNYYVKSASFGQDYPVNSHERAKIDENVDRDYTSTLVQNCRLEMQRKQWGFIRETPHCDMYYRFQSGAAS